MDKEKVPIYLFIASVILLVIALGLKASGLFV
jgi:hypothetical protein